jgi:hypothetical protein
LAAAPSWGFSKVRQNGVMERQLLAKTNTGDFPHSEVLYKITYEDGSVFYSDIFENQNLVTDHYFVKAWTLGGKYIAHGLPTDAWPDLLKQIIQRQNHGELIQVEKMVSSEIPLVTLSQNSQQKVLPIFDANYEGPAARDEEVRLRHRTFDDRYLLSFVFPNGLTISKPIP